MTNGFDIAMDSLSARDRYKLLCGIVVPRPIALVTTCNANGGVNAAPFSFFNVFSEAPPLVILGLQAAQSGALKDTTRNIRRTGEFVVNLVDEDLALMMNDCAIDFPPEIGEPEALGLDVAPSLVVKPARLSASPFALECRQHTLLSFGPERDLLIGEVINVHARSGVMDPDNFHVDIDAYRPLARLFGDYYARLGEVFSMRRESYADRFGP